MTLRAQIAIRLRLPISSAGSSGSSGPLVSDHISSLLRPVSDWTSLTASLRSNVSWLKRDFGDDVISLGSSDDALFSRLPVVTSSALLRTTTRRPFEDVCLSSPSVLGTAHFTVSCPLACVGLSTGFEVSTAGILVFLFDDGAECFQLAGLNLGAFVLFDVVCVSS